MSDSASTISPKEIVGLNKEALKKIANINSSLALFKDGLPPSHMTPEGLETLLKNIDHLYVAVIEDFELARSSARNFLYTATTGTSVALNNF